jgi:hypothetical protein
MVSTVPALPQSPSTMLKFSDLESFGKRDIKRGPANFTSLAAETRLGQQARQNLNATSLSWMTRLSTVTWTILPKHCEEFRCEVSSHDPDDPVERCERDRASRGFLSTSIPERSKQRVK